MAEEKDQSQQTGKSEEIGNLGDVWESEFFESGVDAETDEGAPEPKEKESSKETAKPKPEAEAKKKDEECTDCPDEEKEKREPYKVLKIQGKDVPVYSEEELIQLAQKGGDYTQKTQALSEERKGFEKEREEISSKYQQIMDAINKGKTPGADKAEGQEQSKEEPEDLLKKYGLEEEYAEEWQKKLFKDVSEIKKEREELKSENQKLGEAYQYMMLDGMLKSVKEAVNQAREKYPIEEVFSEDGSKNLTQSQFISLLSSKINSPENKQKPIPDLAVETLREIHSIQQSSKSSKPDAGFDEDKLSPDEFKSKFPKLYEKLSGAIGEEAVADYLQKKESHPPSLESKPSDIELDKKKTKKDMSMTESIDEAFKDPEILNAFKSIR